MRLILLSCSLLALFGCADKKTAGTPKPAAPPQYGIRAPERDPMVCDISAVGRFASTWDIRIAQFADSQIEQLGLKALFATPFQTGPETGSEVAAHPLVRLAKSETNILLTVHSGNHLGICSGATASNLLAKLTVSTGVDVLTTPPARMIGTNLAQVSVQDAMTFVLPSSVSGKTALTTSVWVGQFLNLHALSWISNACTIAVSAGFSEFNGYARAKDKGVTASFTLSGMQAAACLTNGDALLLGSPAYERVDRSEHRVPYLSDIPGFGKLFTRPIVRTNLLRTVILLRRIDTVGR